MSNAARRAIPGAGDGGKAHVYNAGTDAFDLTDVATQAEMAAFALTGDLNGSTLSNPQIAAGVVGTTELANSSVTAAKINATGTPSSTTFHRGDNVWAVPAGGGGGATALDDLTDVVISSPSSGQVLAHNGTNFVNSAPASGGSPWTLVNHATPTGTTETIDLAAGNYHRMQHDANLTLSLSNVPSGLVIFRVHLYRASSGTTAFTLALFAGAELVDDAAGLNLPSAQPNAYMIIEFVSTNGASGPFASLHFGNFYP